MLKGVCIKMQTIKKGIKRMAALAGSALMLGSTIAAPALSANLSDFPGMFIKDGELKSTIVVGKVAAPADVVGAVNIAAAMAQATHKKATISGGGAGTAVLTKTDVAGLIHDFALAADGKGTDDEKVDIAFADFKEGFLEETTNLIEGLHDYHGLPMLQDVYVSPAGEPDDSFRVFDIITLDTTKLGSAGNMGFTIDKEVLRFSIAASTLKYKVFIEAPTDADYGAGSTEGDDNIDDYANFTLSGKGDATNGGLGVDNYLPVKIFGHDVRLSDFDAIDNDDNAATPKFVILMGDKKVIHKGKTTEYKGYKITLNDVASGSNTAFFEIVDPSGQTHMFSPNYDDVHKTTPATISKKISEFTIEIRPDTWNSLSTAEVWMGFGDIERTVTDGKKWKDNANKETDWELENICCEVSSTAIKGTSGCSSYGSEGLGTDDARTCIIEYKYSKDKKGSSKGLAKDEFISSPDDKWRLQFHGINVDESAMGDFKVIWATSVNSPFDKKGEDFEYMNGYRLVPPEGATFLLDNKKPVAEIFVGISQDALTTSEHGLDCDDVGQFSKNDSWTEASEANPPRPDYMCTFINYKENADDDDYKFYKLLSGLTGTAYTTSNSNLGAVTNDGAAGSDGPAVRLLAKMYYGTAIYQLGITQIESKGSALVTDELAQDEGTLYIASEEEGSAKIQFLVGFDFAHTAGKDETSIEEVNLYKTTGGIGDTLGTQKEDQIGNYGIIAKSPEDALEAGDVILKMAKKDIRGLVSINSGVTEDVQELKKGDQVGEYTVKDIIPDVPSGDYYTYSNIAVPVALLDSEVSDPTSAMYGDFVLVGGPSANALVQELGFTKWDFCDDADQALPCDAPIALIELKEDAFTVGKKAIVAAGWEAEHTRAACYILQHYYDYEDKLTGTSLKFKTAASVALPIEAADISFA